MMQEKRRQFGLCAAQVPPPFPSKRPSPIASTVAEIARQAVDRAIREAVEAEVTRRHDEIRKLVPSPTISLEDILGAVIAASNGDRQRMGGGGRRVDPEVVMARWLFMYLAAALRRDLSKAEIARALRMDRSTVIHALAYFDARRAAEPLATYCKHPAVAALLAEADKKPRR